MALPVVFVGGPFDGLEEQLDHLPSVVTFDKLKSWPGDMVASTVPVGEDPPEVRYRRVGRIVGRNHVYEYVPLEPV